MKHLPLQRAFCEQLGTFLEYPVDDFRERLMTCAQQIEPCCGPAASHLREFFSRMKRMELAMWQEYYVQTFDLMPSCSLYISVHLFGEESFKRAELMAGLRGAYESRGVCATTELPDHLAVVLRQSPRLTDEEWSELVHLCLLPALTIMIRKLEKGANPYSFLLKTLQALFVGMEKTHV